MISRSTLVSFFSSVCLPVKSIASIFGLCQTFEMSNLHCYSNYTTNFFAMPANGTYL